MGDLLPSSSVVVVPSVYSYVNVDVGLSRPYCARSVQFSATVDWVISVVPRVISDFAVSVFSLKLS